MKDESLMDKCPKCGSQNVRYLSIGSFGTFGDEDGDFIFVCDDCEYSEKADF